MEYNIPETKKRVTHNYVNNKEFYLSMKEYKDKWNLCSTDEERKNVKIPDYAVKCIMLICNNLSTKNNFVNYTYRDEMVSDALLNCVAQVHTFNADIYTNPLAYFTRIAWQAFIRRIKEEKRENYVKHKNMINSNIMEDLLEDSSYVATDNTVSDDIIKDFEDKIKEKKTTTKTTKTKKKKGLEIFIEE